MPTKVNELSEAASSMTADLAKIAALMGGTKAMRAAGKAYLPQWPMEDDKSYQFRLDTSTLFNAFARTVENMAGKPFAEPVTWTDIEPDVEAWFDNIDLCGRNLHVFAQEIFQAGVRDGLTHVLVDHQATVDGEGRALYKTKAEEAAAGVRPYAIHIRQSQILGWLSETVSGAERLSQVRIMESVREPEGEFGVLEVPQVRVLVPGAWQTYRKNQKGDWVLFAQGPTSLDFVPLVTFYTGRSGFMTATPPLLDLADLNIKHWQSSSDQDSLLHTARVPILAFFGAESYDANGKKMEISARTALNLPKDADAKFIEHSGAAIGAGRESLKDLEEQMRSMGAELLVEKPGDVTATQSSIDTAQAQCQLAAMAQGLADFLDQMVDIMAEWAGKPDQGDIDVFDDFAAIGLDAASVGPFVAALVQLVISGLLSREGAFAELKRYGVVNPDLVWEAEQERIASSAPVLTGTAA